MATVSAKVMGGSLQLKEAATVQELATLMGVPTYQATVNGVDEGPEYELTEGMFVTFSEKTKGAAQ